MSARRALAVVGVVVLSAATGASVALAAFGRITSDTGNRVIAATDFVAPQASTAAWASAIGVVWACPTAYTPLWRVTMRSVRRSIALLETPRAKSCLRAT